MTEGRGVLLVTYSYPPRGGVGMLRSVRLARHLSRLGWRVSVLTATGGHSPLTVDAALGVLPGVEVLEARDPDLAGIIGRTIGVRKPLSGGSELGGPAAVRTPGGRAQTRPPWWLALRGLLLFPDAQVGWIRAAVKRGRERLARGDIDVVVTTSPPESAHLIGSRLKGTTGVPWVAEFRDPWSFSHLRDPSVLDALHRWAEAWVLRRADAIVTVSSGWSRRFQQLYPAALHRVLPNGYDPEELTTATLDPEGRFRIVYTGKLSLEQQDPRPLFQGLAAALRGGVIPRDRVRIVFHCYGDNSEGVADAAAEAGLGSVFEWGGPIDPGASLSVQAGADVLLLVTWARDLDCLPSKLFDYLGSGRRILVLGPPSAEAARLVAESGRGVSAITADECRCVLEAWYLEWARDGRRPAGGDPEAARHHAFAERAREYAALLELVASRRKAAA